MGSASFAASTARGVHHSCGKSNSTFYQKRKSKQNYIFSKSIRFYSVNNKKKTQTNPFDLISCCPTIETAIISVSLVILISSFIFTHLIIQCCINVYFKSDSKTNVLELSNQ